MPGAIAQRSTISPLGQRPTPQEMLVDVARLEREYYTRRPDLEDPIRLVSFGTSGHRGSSLTGTFTEAHIQAIAQAICDYRRARRTDGPIYMGKDTHALSGPAQSTALEVLAANGIDTVIQQDDGVTPTPVISWAILAYNYRRKEHLADGIVIASSHNPPEDGGLKYNGTNGGPADTDATRWIENRANQLLRGGNADVKRMPSSEAINAASTHEDDFVIPYVCDLRNVLDMDAIRSARLKLAADPLGGAALPYWEPISSIYRLDIAVVNPSMDCSRPNATARFVNLRDRHQVAFVGDSDSGRHGIVTPSAGPLKPDNYLAVAIRYLLTYRPQWEMRAAVGKTVVSSSIIDWIARKLGRRLCEVPVGFKWFTKGLFDGSLCIGSEESAGTSFQRRDGSVWTTDKDGLIMNLLAAEITARTGRDPGEHFRELSAEFGSPHSTRIDSPATPEQKARLEGLSAEAAEASTLAGESIIAKLTRAPGNNAPIGGLKVMASSGWFAARASGTENQYKIYAESFRNEAHLDTIVTEASEIVDHALGS